MKNTELLELQNSVNDIATHRPGLRKSNAMFVGCIAYLWLHDPYEKLLAQIDAMERFNRLTKSEQQQSNKLKRAIITNMTAFSKHATPCFRKKASRRNLPRTADKT